MCGLDIAPVSYIGGAVGGGGGAATPDYSVALFADLPADATVGQRVAVTGESGLSGVVCVNTAANTWELESVSCSWAALDAIEWGGTAGRWYSGGGITVDSADGAAMFDTTYGIELRWKSASSALVPPDFYSSGLANLKDIKGDSITPTGWVAADNAPGGTGALATKSTDGEWVTLGVAGTTGALASSGWTLTDTGAAAGSFTYMRGLLKSWDASNAGSGYAFAHMQLSDGTYGAGMAVAALGATKTIGKYAIVAGGSWSIPSAQAAVNADLTTETLFEMRRNGTQGWQARVGGAAGIWQTLARTDGWSSARIGAAFYAGYAAIAGGYSATMKIKRVRYMRRA